MQYAYNIYAAFKQLYIKIITLLATVNTNLARAVGPTVIASLLQELTAPLCMLSSALCSPSIESKGEEVGFSFLSSSKLVSCVKEALAPLALVSLCKNNISSNTNSSVLYVSPRIM